MLDGLPRRKRQLVWTSVLAIAFVAIALGVVRLFVSPEEAYRPGQEVEGLTATLSRDLPDDPPEVRFVDAAAEAGIGARHFPGVRSSQLPEDMGSGAAWGDYDNDGWQDLLLVNIAGPLGGAEAGPAEDASRGEDAQSGEDAPTAGRSTLYRNLGNGRFEDATDASGIRHAAVGMGAAWADYDGDGWRDLVITAYGSNTLYRNAGDGTFVDVTRAAGLSRDVGFWSGAAWGDYDRDGDPDLYVTGYARYTPGANAGVRLLQYDVEVPASLNPSSYRPERNLLYRNEGDGTFTEVAAAAGVDGLEGRGLSAVWADFDGDGWLDLYVANDVSDNALYRNRGDGTFEDVSHAALVADYRGAMGLAVGDWDGDGDPDLFITHWIAQENALFTNRGSPARPLQFLDEADRYGLGQIALDYVGWGTSFFDYDNDGRPDLFVANGSTFQRDDDPTRLVPMQDQLFWNRGDEGFFDVSAVAGPWFVERHVGRGAAFADYDRDGDVDIVVVNHGERPALLRNEGGNRAAWLAVALAGDPVGARVRVVAAGRSRVQWLGVQSSYLSGNSPVLHFGLGEAAVVDTVEVTWPDGTTDAWVGVEARHEIRLSKGGAAPELALGAVPRSASGGTTQAAATSDAVSPDDRERTRRFWETYREATRLRTTGDLEGAARRLEEAHALDPVHEDALYYLGGVRADLGDPAGALDALDELVRLNPRSGRALMRRGALLACPAPGAPTDLARARTSFEAAWAINREQVGPPLWLGVVELLAGDLPAAAERLDDVLGSHRDNVAARVLRGYIAHARGDDAAGRADPGMVAGGAGDEAGGAAAELGLREGDTTSDRALFTGACPWLEETLRAAVGAASPEAAYEALRARFEAAGAPR